MKKRNQATHSRIAWPQKSINLTLTYGDYCNLGKCLQLVLRIFRHEVTEKEHHDNCVRLSLMSGTRTDGK